MRVSHRASSGPGAGQPSWPEPGGFLVHVEGLLRMVGPGARGPGGRHGFEAHTSKLVLLLSVGGVAVGRGCGFPSFSAL